MARSRIQKGRKQNRKKKGTFPSIGRAREKVAEYRTDSLGPLRFEEKKGFQGGKKGLKKCKR